MNDLETGLIYKAVMNHEEQYSIWPAERENALGWRDAGFSGSKADCLAYIKEQWTDMRPLSLRQQIATLSETPPVVSIEASNSVIPAISEEKQKRGFLGRIFSGKKKQ